MDKMYHKISGFSDEIAKETDIQFEVLNRLGIEYFEPRGIDGMSISRLSDEEVYALKDKMKQHGIKVSAIGSPIGKMKPDVTFEEHFEVFKRVVRTAKLLDARYIRMFSFFHDGSGEWTAEQREEVLARLRKMIQYAQEQDVILLHENEKDIYGDTADRCLDLMKELSCEHFRAIFDFANFVQCGQDTKDAYEKLKDYIEYIHVKDAMLADGSVVPAGYGDGNVEYILNDIITNGFNGFLSLEPHLGNFQGLAELELDDKMKNLPEGGEGTFTLAYRSLCEILNRISCQ